MSCAVPLRTSRSRIPAVPVSIVTARAEKPASLSSLDGSLSGVAATNEIKLVPDRPGGRRLDVLQFMSGNRRKNVCRYPPRLRRGQQRLRRSGCIRRL